MSLLPYKDEVKAKNEISTTSEDFTFGANALEKTFTIIEPGRYSIGIGYKWFNARVQDQHRVRILIDDVEKEGLSINQALGGVLVGAGIKPGTERIVLHDFVVGDFLIEMQFSTDKAGQISTLIERGLFISRYD